MKFLGIKKFTGKTPEDIRQYLAVEVSKAFSDLFRGLSRLTVSENLAHFYADVEIAAGDEVSIPNRLGSPDLVWWPVRATVDNTLVDGDTAFTSSFVSIQNVGASDVTATLLFVRR
jgi:hypothetical protein